MHDSGLERAHAADLAAELAVPFAALAPATHGTAGRGARPRLAPANPLDVWGTGRDTEPLFAECLSALADDPAVAAVALAVDLVPEFDGDESYPQAVLTAAAGTAKPVAVLAGLPSAVDQAAAARLRTAGVPVLEGTRTGLLALRHLLDHAGRPSAPPARAHPAHGAAPLEGPAPPARRTRPVQPAARLRHPGRARRRPRTRGAALAAAAAIGYPVVLKTDEPGIAHKSDVGGVRLGLADPGEAGAAYDDLAARLGPRVVVCETAPPGTELALGIVRDLALGPLLVIGAGGVLVEFLAERAVLLAPVTRSAARRRCAGSGSPRYWPGAAASPPPTSARSPTPSRPFPPGLRPGRRPGSPRHQPPHLRPRRPRRRRRPPHPPPPHLTRHRLARPFMIVASFRCYVARTGHDHGPLPSGHRYDHCG